MRFNKAVTFDTFVFIFIFVRLDHGIHYQMPWRNQNILIDLLFVITIQFKAVLVYILKLPPSSFLKIKAYKSEVKRELLLSNESYHSAGKHDRGPSFFYIIFI